MTNLLFSIKKPNIRILPMLTAVQNELISQFILGKVTRGKASPGGVAPDENGLGIARAEPYEIR